MLLSLFRTLKKNRDIRVWKFWVRSASRLVVGGPFLLFLGLSLSDGCNGVKGVAMVDGVEYPSESDRNKTMIFDYLSH